MMRAALIPALTVCLLSACVGPQAHAPQPDATTAPPAAAQAITGTNGDVEFTLSDDVFKVERPALVHLLLVAVYLPLVFM